MVSEMMASGATWHTNITMAPRKIPMDAMAGRSSPSKGGSAENSAMMATARISPMIRFLDRPSSPAPPEAPIAIAIILSVPALIKNIDHRVQAAPYYSMVFSVRQGAIQHFLQFLSRYIRHFCSIITYSYVVKRIFDHLRVILLCDSVFLSYPVAKYEGVCDPDGPVPADALLQQLHPVTPPRFSQCALPSPPPCRPGRRREKCSKSRERACNRGEPVA